MPSVNLIETYRRYKQDTNNIATWLVNTARRFGFSTAGLGGNTVPTVSKSQRLKGKARAKAKEAGQFEASNATASSWTSLPVQTIGVKDFITLAEFLATKSDVEISSPFWKSLDRAIRLRRLHGDYHALQKVNSIAGASLDGHSYFLDTLEKVKDLLKPHLKAIENDTSASPVMVPMDERNEQRLQNMFAALTVEEPPEEVSKMDGASAGSEAKKSSSTVCQVNTSNDPFELYLAIAALLKDYLQIRHAVKEMWQDYARGLISLISVAATTNVAIQMAQTLEDQFLKDFPSQSGTIGARNTFFAVQCSLQKQDPSARARPSDPMNLNAYPLVEISLLNCHVLVDSFGDVLADNPLPMYKPGFFGVYDPTVDRSKLSGPQKFDQDKVILLEVLSDIVWFDFANRKSVLPAVDELTKAVGLFRERGRHTLTLDFAAQLHLDIRHLSGANSGTAWAGLKHYAAQSRGTLKQNLEFHKNLRVENWPRENDKILNMIRSRIERWYGPDTLQQLKSDMMAQPGLPRPEVPDVQHAFFTSHPWLCGSLLFGLKLDMQEVGITFLNAWGSAKFAAQIYNAVRQEKFLDEKWEDMELALMIYGEPAMFVGGRPTSTEECFKHFCLSMGYSAQNFAKGGKRPHVKVLESANGPRGLLDRKVATPVAHELRFGYLSLEGSAQSAPDLDKVLASASDDGPIVGTGSHAKRKSYTLPQALLQICQGIMSEDLALTFDLFYLHRTCWRALRGVKDANAEQLRQYYGPNWLETESQLPFVVGYILMTAVSTEKVGKLLLPKKEGVVTSKLLMRAAEDFKGMVETGSGGLGIHILREQYGMEYEVEIESV